MPWRWLGNGLKPALWKNKQFGSKYTQEGVSELKRDKRNRRITASSRTKDGCLQNYRLSDGYHVFNPYFLYSDLILTHPSFLLSLSASPIQGTSQKQPTLHVSRHTLFARSRHQGLRFSILRHIIITVRQTFKKANKQWLQHRQTGVAYLFFPKSFPLCLDGGKQQPLSLFFSNPRTPPPSLPLCAQKSLSHTLGIITVCLKTV